LYSYLKCKSGDKRSIYILSILIIVFLNSILSYVDDLASRDFQFLLLYSILLWIRTSHWITTTFQFLLLYFQNVTYNLTVSLKYYTFNSYYCIPCWDRADRRDCENCCF